MKIEDNKILVGDVYRTHRWHALGVIWWYFSLNILTDKMTVNGQCYIWACLYILFNLDHKIISRQISHDQVRASDCDCQWLPCVTLFMIRHGRRQVSGCLKCLVCFSFHYHTVSVFQLTVHGDSGDPGVNAQQCVMVEQPLGKGNVMPQSHRTGAFIAKGRILQQQHAMTGSVQVIFTSYCRFL